MQMKRTPWLYGAEGKPTKLMDAESIWGVAGTVIKRPALLYILN